jgi:hypothetical protein
MFLNSTVASLAVQELANLLLDFKPCQPYLLYELLAGRLMALAAERRPECAVCGLHAGAGDAAATPWQAGESVPENLPAVSSTGE